MTPNCILAYYRVAVHPTDDRPWEWFSPVVVFTLRHYDTAMAVLEDQCVEAALRYPTSRICTVRAPNREAYDRADMHQFGP